MLAVYEKSSSLRKVKVVVYQMNLVVSQELSENFEIFWENL